MNAPMGAMQSLQMLTAAMMSSRPDVDKVQQLGPRQQMVAPVGGRGAGGGVGTGLATIARSMNQSSPNNQALEMAFLDTGEPMPDELLDAQDEMLIANRTLAQSQNQRFRLGSKLGNFESIFDLVRGPWAHKKALETRREYNDQELAYKQDLLKREKEKEIVKRKAYVDNVLPLLEAKFPGLNPDQRMGIAVQAASQELALEKLFPDGVAAPTSEEFLGPNGETMVRWRSEDGAILTGDKFQPYIKKGPTDKTTKPTDKWSTRENKDGSKDMVLYGPPDANGELPILGETRISPPTPEGAELKPMATMPAENRNKLGLVATAADMYATAIPHLMDEGGNWNHTVPYSFGSEGLAAYNSLRSGVMDLLRAESGAVLADTEIENMADRFVPVATDSTTTAKAKLNRLWTKLSNQHQAFTSGFTDVPPDLFMPDVVLHWNGMGDDAEVGEAMAGLSLDEKYEAAMRQAQQQAQQQGQQ